MNSKQLKTEIKALWKIIEKLEYAYKDSGRKFTLDGHLLGSIGEVYAADKYGLTLLPSSTKGHDAEDDAGNLIQIKVTQREKVGLRFKPDFLIVLKLEEDGSFKEIYNGKGGKVWEISNKINSAGQRIVTLNKLRKINKSP